MNTIRNLILAIFCIATFACTFASAATSLGHIAKQEFTSKLKSLPWKERAFLHLASVLSPKSFASLDKESFAEIAEYPFEPLIDSVFVDARQILTQVKKVPEDANLPEFNWGYGYNFCFWGYCFDVKVTFDTQGSKLIGVDNIKSSTEITPTSIQNTFEVPFFNWTSPGFVVNYTDFVAREYHLNKNCYYSFQNVTVAFAADYHFVPDVGIQIENLTIYFNAGRIRGGLMEFEYWDFEGNLLEKYVNDPEEYPIDRYWMNDWDQAKKSYTPGFQYSLNCFLSNGRSDPSGCVLDGDIERQYFQHLNMQFIQTLGLGALLNK